MTGLVDFEKGVNVAAGNVVNLLAGAETTADKLSAGDPLVAAGVKLAEQEVPGLSQAVGVFDAVLTLAKTIVAATQGAAAAAAALPATS